MQIWEALRGSIRFVREGVYESCPNRMSNIDRRNNAENDGASNVQIQSTENNQPMPRLTPTRTALPELPPLNDNERSFVCCCLTSQSAFRLFLLTYWLWTLASFSFNADTVLPALLYFLPFCTMLLAFIGSTTGNYKLIIPFVFMAAWDILYAGICPAILVSFHKSGRTIWTNQFLYDYWPEKAKEFEAMNRENYELFLVILLLKFLYAIIAFIITIQETSRLEIQKFNEKQRRAIIRLRELQNERDEIQLRNFLNDVMQPPQPQDPFAEIFAQVPPPPSYQTFSHPVLRTPQLGTPPPTYSMLERDGRLQPIPIQWSPTSSQNDGQQRTDSSEISIDLKRFDTASTAMSPSSFLQSPPHSSTSSSPKEVAKGKEG